MSFVHLHTHSHYSLLDGLSKVPDLVKKAKSYGMPALALTDHGVLYGAIEFYKECRKQGIVFCPYYSIGDWTADQVMDKRFADYNTYMKAQLKELLEP